MSLEPGPAAPLAAPPALIDVAIDGVQAPLDGVVDGVERPAGGSGRSRWRVTTMSTGQQERVERRQAVPPARLVLEARGGDEDARTWPPG